MVGKVGGAVLVLTGVAAVAIVANQFMKEQDLPPLPDDDPSDPGQIGSVDLRNLTLAQIDSNTISASILVQNFNSFSVDGFVKLQVSFRNPDGTIVALPDTGIIVKLGPLATESVFIEFDPLFEFPVDDVPGSSIRVFATYLNINGDPISNREFETIRF